MDYSEQGSHERVVYPTLDTTHMGTVRARKEEVDKNNSKREIRNFEEMNVGAKEKSFKQGITMELLSSYHRLD